MAWSFAPLQFLDPPLFSAISAAERPKMSAFTPQNLSNLSWAFSPFALLDIPLIASISAEAISTMDLFNA